MDAPTSTPSASRQGRDYASIIRYLLSITIPYRTVAPLRGAGQGSFRLTRHCVPCYAWSHPSGVLGSQPHAYYGATNRPERTRPCITPYKAKPQCGGRADLHSLCVPTGTRLCVYHKVPVVYHYPIPHGRTPVGCWAGVGSTVTALRTVLCMVAPLRGAGRSALQLLHGKTSGRGLGSSLPRAPSPACLSAARSLRFVQGGAENNG